MMKTPLVGILSVLSLCACDPQASEIKKAESTVPHDWYRLPEEGPVPASGSLEKLGTTVDALLQSQSRSLELLPRDARPETAPAGAKPADWVPWHLAGFSSDFALTGEGVFGALLFDGTASVQVNWFRAPHEAVPARKKAPAARMPAGQGKKTADLTLEGHESDAQLQRKLEPGIRAALATGRVRNARGLRANVLKVARDFRAMSRRLSTLRLSDLKVRPNSFRLEIELNADGQVTPLVSAGGEVRFRFDWVVKDDDDMRASVEDAQDLSSPIGQKLETFVRSMAPDLEVAVNEAKPLRKSGFELSFVRVGLGMTADYDFGVAQTSASLMASIGFGADDDDHHGCFDPDGDGDCHSRSLALETESVSPDDGGIPLIAADPSPQHLDFARSMGVETLVTSPQPQHKTAIFRVRHDKFRAGLKKAVSMAGFFVRHASTAKTGTWKIREIETEFSLSLTGNVGLATLAGVGELELEFEREGN